MVLAAMVALVVGFMLRADPPPPPAADALPALPEPAEFDLPATAAVASPEPLWWSGWRPLVLPGEGTLTVAAGTDGGWVTLGGGLLPLGWWSEDGVNWQPSRFAPDLQLPVEVAGVVYSPGEGQQVVAAATLPSAGGPRPLVMASSDGGSTWERDAAGPGGRGGLTDLVDHGGLVATGWRLGTDGEREAVIWRSAEGRAWEEVVLPTSAADTVAHAVAPSGGGLVAVGGGADGPMMWRSEDGRRWEEVPLPVPAGEPRWTSAELADAIASPEGELVLVVRLREGGWGRLVSLQPEGGWRALTSSFRAQQARLGSDPAGGPLVIGVHPEPSVPTSGGLRRVAGGLGAAGSVHDLSFRTQAMSVAVGATPRGAPVVWLRGPGSGGASAVLPPASTPGWRVEQVLAPASFEPLVLWRDESGVAVETREGLVRLQRDGRADGPFPWPGSWGEAAGLVAAGDGTWVAYGTTEDGVAAVWLAPDQRTWKRVELWRGVVQAVAAAQDGGLAAYGREDRGGVAVPARATSPDGRGWVRGEPPPEEVTANGLPFPGGAAFPHEEGPRLWRGGVALEQASGELVPGWPPGLVTGRRVLLLPDGPEVWLPRDGVVRGVDAFSGRVGLVTANQVWLQSAETHWEVLPLDLEAGFTGSQPHLLLGEEVRVVGVNGDGWVTVWSWSR